MFIVSKSAKERIHTHCIVLIPICNIKELCIAPWFKGVSLALRQSIMLLADTTTYGSLHRKSS